MAAFEDRIQSLMDEVYTEWQKDENRGKDKWDVLDGFSEAHRIAVVFGNFHYQVGNGGIEQWIYNGYFHDDVEKFIEYLEAGALADERCKTILDRVSRLDRYANETDCDRHGYFRDSDDRDGDDGFIGDEIDCDAFDTWYYANCDGEDWCKTICGLIDKAQALETAPAVPAMDKPEVTAVPPPIQVYIENANDPSIGGFTIPLPTTREALAPWLSAIQADMTDPDSIRIAEVRSPITELGRALRQTDYSLDELNYLAVKISGLSGDKKEIFFAALEADRHGGDVDSLINLTENLGLFELQPAFSEAQYGEFLVSIGSEENEEMFQYLHESAEPVHKQVIEYIERIEKYVDHEAYGRDAARDEDGVFTGYGYITEQPGYLNPYIGPEDIPKEYRIFPNEAPQTESGLDEAGTHTASSPAPAERESVLDKIREAREAAKNAPKSQENSGHKKSYEPEV